MGASLCWTKKTLGKEDSIYVHTIGTNQTRYSVSAPRISIYRLRCHLWAGWWTPDVELVWLLVWLLKRHIPQFGNSRMGQSRR